MRALIIAALASIPLAACTATTGVDDTHRIGAAVAAIKCDGPPNANSRDVKINSLSVTAGGPSGQMLVANVTGAQASNYLLLDDTPPGQFAAVATVLTSAMEHGWTVRIASVRETQGQDVFPIISTVLVCAEKSDGTP